MHPEYYYSDGKQDMAEIYDHVDHCLETLRQELMCSADSSIVALRWTSHNRDKPSVVIPQPRVCVDWNGLHDWMRRRAAKGTDMVRPSDNLYTDSES
jgi:hypothetical protein